MKRTVNRFTDDLKHKVALEYLTTDQSIENLMNKYNIRGNSCITNWVRKFGFKRPTSSELEIRKRMSESKKRTDLEKEQALKISKLEELLKREKLKVKAFDTLIDIAEDKLKIDIRKKSGSNQ